MVDENHDSASMVVCSLFVLRPLSVFGTARCHKKTSFFADSLTLWGTDSHSRPCVTEIGLRNFNNWGTSETSSIYTPPWWTIVFLGNLWCLSSSKTSEKWLGKNCNVVGILVAKILPSEGDYFQMGKNGGEIIFWTVLEASLRIDQRLELGK